MKIAKMLQNMTPNVVLLTISIYLCVHLVSGRPIATTTTPIKNPCGSDEVARLVNEMIKCWRLSTSCPKGKGLTVEAGNKKVYSVHTRIGCDLCIKGSTYSDKHDFSQCKNCTTCWENEVAVGRCTIYKDSIKCECKPGFYRANNDLSRCTKCKTCGENEFAVGQCTIERDNITCECKPRFYRANDDLRRCTKCKTCGENEFAVGQCTIERDNITCECKPGFYRANDDLSRCTKCKTCGENEFAVGQCTIYKDSIKCECKPGFYRANDDLSQCTKCKTCGKNEFAIGQCTSERDNITCECKAGYYRSHDDGCKSCTRCCGQSKSAETMCDPTPSYNSTLNSTDRNSTGNLKPNSEKTKMKSQDLQDPLGGILLSIFVGLIVLISLVMVCFVYNKRNGPQYLFGNGNGCAPSIHQRYVMIRPKQALHNQSNSSVELSSELLLCEASHRTNGGQGNFATDGLMQEDRSIPSALDLSEEECEVNTPRMVSTAKYGKNQWEPSFQVTQLPEEKLQSISKVLDEKDDFHKDYRMFAEELGMEKPAIEDLANKKSQTLTILKMYKVTIETFLDIIQTIRQNGASNHAGKLEHVTSRIEDLAKIEEDVKSCLAHSTA